MTIEKHLEAHYEARRNLIDAEPILRTTWEVERQALEKLKEVREAAAWLARNMNDLVAKIDATGLAYPIHPGSSIGNLASRVEVAGVECAGLRDQIATLKRLAGGTE